MRLQTKLIIVLLLTFLGSFILVEIIDYQHTREDTMEIVREEAHTIRNVLMATRRVYHQQFLDSGLPLTPKTIGFLPAHALSRISKDFDAWEKNGVSFNNVSDRARNPSNQANEVELEALRFFREHPTATERLVYADGPDGGFFHFSTPIWIEKYCLKCHGSSADAPPTIRDAYDAGFDYREGDLRGIISIKIPERIVVSEVKGNLLQNMWVHLLGFLFAAGVLSLVLRRSVLLPVAQLRTTMTSLNKGLLQETSLPDETDEIADLNRVFSVMANEIQVRQEALADSEEKLRRMVTAMPEGVALLSSDGLIKQANPALASLLECDEDDLLQQSICKFLPCGQDTFLTLQAALVGPLERNLTIVRPSGRRVAVELQLRSLATDSVEPGAFLLTLRDQSVLQEMEQAFQALIKSLAVTFGQECLDRIVEELTKWFEADMVLLGELSPDGTVVALAAQLDGRSLDDFSYPLAGTPCEMAVKEGFCLYSEKVRDEFPAAQHLAELGVESYAGAGLTDENGESFGCLSIISRRPLLLPYKAQEVLTIVAARAVAEVKRLRTQRRLAQGEARYRKLSQQFQTVLDGIPDSLSLVGPDYRVIWANLGTARLLNVEPAKLTGRYCFDLWQQRGEPCEACPLQHSFETGEVRDAKISTPDGRSWGIKTFPQKDKEGKVTGVICLASDITERLKLREESSRASRLAALGELAAGVAHEINNPNGVILLNTPILEKTFAGALPILEDYYREHGNFPLGDWDFLELREEVPKMLEEMQDGATRIKRIVNDLKDFVRQDALTMEERFDLNDAVQAALRLCGNVIRRATDRLETSFEENLPPVAGHVHKIEQVLVNLLMNACQALSEKKQGLFVTTRYDSRNRINIVEVHDEGAGIEPADLTKLINPFFTTKREQGGTGLGLSVSDRIAKEHGGKLLFSSEPGKGTTATLILPISQEPTDG